MEKEFGLFLLSVWPVGMGNGSCWGVGALNELLDVETMLQLPLMSPQLPERRESKPLQMPRDSVDSSQGRTWEEGGRRNEESAVLIRNSSYTYSFSLTRGEVFLSLDEWKTKSKMPTSTWMRIALSR